MKNFEIAFTVSLSASSHDKAAAQALLAVKELSLSDEELHLLKIGDVVCRGGLAISRRVAVIN